MTLQERLRAGSLPKGVMDHWGGLQCEAADRIDELEEVLNSHAPGGHNYTNGQHIALRLKCIELEKQVVELTRTLQYERENPVFTGKCDTWQAACGIARSRVVELEKELHALKENKKALVAVHAMRVGFAKLSAKEQARQAVEAGLISEDHATWAADALLTVSTLSKDCNTKQGVINAQNATIKMLNNAMGDGATPIADLVNTGKLLNERDLLQHQRDALRERVDGLGRVIQWHQTDTKELEAQLEAKQAEIERLTK